MHQQRNSKQRPHHLSAPSAYSLATLIPKLAVFWTEFYQRSDSVVEHTETDTFHSGRWITISNPDLVSIGHNRRTNTIKTFQWKGSHGDNNPQY